MILTIAGLILAGATAHAAPSDAGAAPRAPRAETARPKPATPKSSADSTAAAGELRPWLYAGIGLLADQVGRSSGQLFAPALVLQCRIDIGIDRMPLSPFLGVTLLPKKTSDGSVSTILVPVGVRLSRELGSWDFRGGIGSLIRSVSGSGGESVQRNGTSTATFALPSGTSVSSLLFMDAGLGLQLGRIRSDFDVLVTGLASDRRAVDLLFTVSYGIL